jgi:hypothetical protein
VFFTFKLTRSEAGFSIRDEEPGFDSSTLPDPADSETLGSRLNETPETGPIPNSLPVLTILPVPTRLLPE